MEREKPLLETAEILHARDDFLAGIAALLEIDAAEEIPVRRLRHEQVGRRCRDPAARRRQCRCHRHTSFSTTLAWRASAARRIGALAVAATIDDASIGQHERTSRRRRTAAATSGAGTTPNASRAAAALPAPASPISAWRAVASSTVTLARSTNIASRAPDGFGEIGREQHDDSGVRVVRRRAPQHAVGEHAALRRVVAPVLTVARGERADVARQLALEERRRIVAGHAQHAPADVRRRRRGRALRRGRESDAGRRGCSSRSGRGARMAARKVCRARITSYRGCPFTCDCTRDGTGRRGRCAGRRCDVFERVVRIRTQSGTTACSRHRPHRTPAFQGVGPCQSRRPGTQAAGGGPTLIGARHVRHHASDAGGRRPLRPPDPLLESEDGRVHLRPAQQDPHRQPREDAADVPGCDEVRAPARRATGARSSSSAPSARRARSSPRKRSAAGMPYVDHRWLGGMLTNFKTVKGSIKRLKDLDAMKADGTFERMSKREALSLHARARQAPARASAASRT